MARLTLHFAYRDGQIELQKTVFQSSTGSEFTAARGKTGGAYGCNGSFQWTPAVRAICVFFLQALCREPAVRDTTIATLSGQRGSLASSLDYAINKEPQWLCDMFGLDGSGKTNFRRLIFRSNTNVKHPGPVTISLNEAALPATNITVFVDSVPIEGHEQFRAILAALSDTSSALFPLRLPASVQTPGQIRMRFLASASAETIASPA